jgi:hypothetical protein
LDAGLDTGAAFDAGLAAEAGFGAAFEAGLEEAVCQSLLLIFYVTTRHTSSSHFGVLLK